MGVFIDFSRSFYNFTNEVNPVVDVTSTAYAPQIVANTASGFLQPIVLDVILTFDLICAGVIGVLGIMGNVINIIIYHKHGYQDSVNVTLTALAISDIGALVTLVIYIETINPWSMKAELSYKPVDVAYMTVFYPHNYFIRVCGFVTAFASFERCLCVLAPLHVKKIITNKRTFIAMISIYTLILLDLLPIYYVAYLDYNTIAVNITKLSIAFRQNPYNVFGISYFITDLFVPYFTFFIIISCTIVIAAKLKTRAVWRQSVTSTVAKSSDAVPKKEKKLVVMLVVVSAIFVVCLIPQSAFLTAIGLVSELSIFGAYLDLTVMLSSVSFLAESVSSSVNIIVYYKMSSKYRETFQSMYPSPFQRNR